jgi:C-terminal processing protease CtpA/Prc
MFLYLGSVAHLAGVEVGDTILRVNGEDCLDTTEQQIQEIMKKGQTVIYFTLYYDVSFHTLSFED